MDDKMKKVTQVGIPTKTVSWAALIGFLTAYTHFFGYSFFKAKLEAVGFDNVKLSLSTEESLYYAIEALSYAVFKIDNLVVLTQASSLLIGLMVGGFFIPFIFYGIKKLNVYKESHPGLKEYESIGEYFTNLIAGKIHSFKFAFLLALPSSILTALFYVFFLGVVIYSITVFWLFAILGMAVGNKTGQEEYVNQSVCKSFDWKDVTANRKLGCRTIDINDGDNSKTLKGKRLYKDDKTTYFITNNGAYEISVDGVVQVFIPFHRKPESKEIPSVIIEE